MLKDFYKPLVHLRSLSFWTTGLLLDYWYFQASKWYRIFIVTFRIIVPCANFVSGGRIAHDDQLLECVAARLVGKGQVELELRTAVPEVQFEVSSDQLHRQSAA